MVLRPCQSEAAGRTLQERWSAASRPGEEWEHLNGSVLVGATTATVALLVHLERELAACQRHGGQYVDHFWPLLRGLLGAVLFGGGTAQCLAMLDDFIDVEKGARCCPAIGTPTQLPWTSNTSLFAQKFRCHGILAHARSC